MSKERYGLKTVAHYDAEDFKFEDIIFGSVKENSKRKDNVKDQVLEKLIINESGTYNIIAHTDLMISHDMSLKYLHINLTLLSDNINVKILSRGIIKDNIIDIYHKVINEGKNNKCEVLLDIIADENANLIYRSSIDSNNIDATIIGKSDAKILSLDNSNKLVVEPAVVMLGDASSSSHSMSIRNISREETEYMLLYGLDINNYKDLIKSNYA